MKITITTFFVTYFLVIGHGQNLKFSGVLPAISQTGKLSNKLNYNLFISTTIDAFDTKIGGINYPANDLQLYIQPSIIYIVNPNFNLAGSYTYQRNNPFENNYSNEHRLWQQVVLAHPLGNARMSHRFRLEERFIQNRVTGLYPFSSRLRYQIAYTKPLQGKTLDPGEIYLSAYNEFYSTLTTPRNAFYSENWSYVGLGFQTKKIGKIELGYLLQFAVRNSAKDLRVLNLMQVMWITNLKLKK